MLKYNMFIILAILCAKTTNADILNLASVPLKAASAVESLLENISATATDSTDTEDSEEECCGGALDIHTEDSEEECCGGALDIRPEEAAENKCTGGVLDFIQCVVGKKIETFRRELSTVAFPNKPPQESQPTIDSKIEGSLGDWIQKFIKHSTMQKENNTVFEENGTEPFVRESDSQLAGFTNATAGPEEAAENKCTGGVLDFIQCVVGKKIETFRRELSKVAFPNKPPQESHPTIDSRIEGSLGDWIQKYIKHSTMQKENCTSGTPITDFNEFEEEV